MGKKSSAAETSRAASPRKKHAPQRLDPSDQAETAPQTKGKRGRPRASSATPTRSPKKPKTSSAKSGPRKPKADPNQDYEVESILDINVLVKWKDYPKSSATWEPLGHLKGCEEVVVAYLEEVKKKLNAEGEEEEKGGSFDVHRVEKPNRAH